MFVMKVILVCFNFESKGQIFFVVVIVANALKTKRTAMSIKYCVKSFPLSAHMCTAWKQVNAVAQINSQTHTHNIAEIAGNE